jgi:myosin heavy subunit
MTTLAFSAEEQENIFGVLAAVLHIGNIRFVNKPGAKSEQAEVENPEGAFL